MLTLNQLLFHPMVNKDSQIWHFPWIAYLDMQVASSFLATEPSISAPELTKIFLNRKALQQVPSHFQKPLSGVEPTAVSNEETTGW